MRTLITIIAGMLAQVTALASGGHGGESHILMWVFLSFFALIVVSQIIPVVSLATKLEKVLHR